MMIKHKGFLTKMDIMLSLVKTLSKMFQKNKENNLQSTEEDEDLDDNEYITFESK